MSTDKFKNLEEKRRERKQKKWSNHWVEENQESIVKVEAGSISRRQWLTLAKIAESSSNIN